MTVLIDLKGQTFGKLTVIQRQGSRKNGAGTKPMWLVRCVCGTEKQASGPELRSGKTVTCGCRIFVHGMYGTPEYNAWRSMISRCENPKADNYGDYGGRGISVCPEWRLGFKAFFLAMGPRPSFKHSLDRRDNGGNYEPGNCRWATVKEQARNKRTCHVLTVGGESATLAEWAERTGLGKTTIRERLRRGWSPEMATATPVP